MRRSLLAVTAISAVSVGLLLVGCTSTDRIVAVPDAVPAPTTTAEPQAEPQIEIDNEGVEAAPDNVPDRQNSDGRELTAEEVIDRTIEDLEAFWAEQMPDVYGQDYEQVSGGFFPYSSTEPPPSCNDIRSTYEEMRGNAFYCSPDDLVAWDVEDLIPQLNEEFGSFAISVVFAHEWGHAIQGRLGVLGTVPTIVTEQQADCFAGAWTKHIAEGESDTLDLPVGAMESGISALIELRDPPGLLEAVEQGAHGVAFDRINAFQHGFDGGAVACEPLIRTPLDVTEVAFSSRDEAQSGGDIAADELLELVPDALNAYWIEGASVLDLQFAPITTVRAFDPSADTLRCDGDQLDPESITGEIFVCVPDGYVAFDRQLGASIHEEIGDWALATLLSRQWVSAVLLQNGEDDATRDAELASACYTGSFSKTVVDGIEVDNGGQAGRFSISPGDLDEAVITYLLFSEHSSEADADDVTAFDRIRAFRQGFFEGEGSCR